MRLLVTGAAGFIGSVTASVLVEAGHDVVALDDLSRGREGNVPPGVSFVRGRVGDAALVRTLGPFDGCVHFAAYFAPGESMATPETFFANNVAETFSLAATLVEMGVPRFVFSSSCAVYGDDVTIPITESHPTRPHSPYGESKLMVEHGLRWLSALGRMRTASLRYFNAAGATPGRPERHVPEVHLIPLALAAAAGERDAVEIYGDHYRTEDGTCVRDYVHVVDLADAHHRALTALEAHDHLVVNLGTGTGYSVREVVDAVQRITGVAFPVRVVAPRPGDPAAAVASNDVARTVLGWRPAHSSLDQIVGDAWAARAES